MLLTVIRLIAGVMSLVGLFLVSINTFHYLEFLPPWFRNFLDQTVQMITVIWIGFTVIVIVSQCVLGFNKKYQSLVLWSFVTGVTTALVPTCIWTISTPDLVRFMNPWLALSIASTYAVMYACFSTLAMLIIEPSKKEEIKAVERNETTAIFT